MDKLKDTADEAILEQLIEHGPGEIAEIFSRAFELAMQIERERFIGVEFYERTAGRQGYANGYKPKRIDTPAGSVTVQVPKTAGHHGEPVGAHILPDILHRVQLRRARGQEDRLYVRGHLELVGPMPSRSIHEQDSHRSLCDVARDFVQMELHRLGIGVASPHVV
jgi:hypothetical protein